MKSIAIEMCVNSDGNFIKAVEENAVWLTRKLMNDLIFLFQGRSTSSLVRKELSS